MYRARADAVSGTGVYADGKWLRCIGNKNVRVGEYVWTDGRCVYGHLQESEQPKVITTQEDEGIPIFDGTSLYTFAKNRLKHVAQIKKEHGKINLYNVIGDELKFFAEMPDTDKWTNFSLMINDDKKTAWLYDGGTHYKAYFYDRKTQIREEGRNFWTDTKLIASNIDKRGNRFDMVIRFKSEFETETEISLGTSTTTKSVNVTAMEILRNGEVVQSVSLQEIYAEIASNCHGSNCKIDPTAADIAGGAHLHAPFIEDEHSWYLWLKTETISDAWENGHYYEFVDDYGLEQYRMFSLCLLTPKGLTKIYEETLRLEFVYDLTLGYPRRYWKVISSSVFKAPRTVMPLQDDFYCELYDFFTAEESLPPDEIRQYDDTTPYSYVTFYSPRGKELFSGITVLPATFPICCLKSKYLLSVDGNADFLDGDDTTDTYNGVRVLRDGLYLISGENWQRLGDSVLNQRLRPMKKFHGWQKRLQRIELEQHEI